MSTQVFPVMPGLAWSVNRKAIWSGTRRIENVSGKTVRMTDWTYPQWEWSVKHNLLRQGTVNGVNYAEMAQLAAFFNGRQGGFDSFLYRDTNDNQVTGQALGVGNGVATQFQLVRSFGGFIEPIYAPNTVTNAYVNGVDPTGWSVSAWGSATPGVITFAAPPGNGLAVTADFTFRFPVAFTKDDMDFEEFMQYLFSAKEIPFRSIK